MYAPGKLWLKISGIITVIIGFGGIMYGIYWGNNVRVLLQGGADKGAAMVVLPYAVFFLLQGIVTLMAGITGVKNADDVENYKKCIILGWIVVACNLVPLFTGGNIVDVLISLVVPICYMIGAILNRYGQEQMRNLK